MVNLEERFAALEAEVAQLRAQLASQYPILPRPVERTSPDFLDTMVGIHANSPLFEEMTRNIEAEREREREAARRLRQKDEQKKRPLKDAA